MLIISTILVGMGLYFIGLHVRFIEEFFAKRKLEPNNWPAEDDWPEAVVLPIFSFMTSLGWWLGMVSMLVGGFCVALLLFGVPVGKAEIYIVVGISLLALRATYYSFMAKRRQEIQLIREGFWVTKRPLDTWLPKK